MKFLKQLRKQQLFMKRLMRLQKIKICRRSNVILSEGRYFVALLNSFAQSVMQVFFR